MQITKHALEHDAKYSNVLSGGEKFLIRFSYLPMTPSLQLGIREMESRGLNIDGFLFSLAKE